MLALLLWFGDFLLSVLHIRTSCEPVEVLVPFTASYVHFEYSDGKGGAACPEDLVRKGSEVELWTGPRASLSLLHGWLSSLWRRAHCGEGLTVEKGTCFPHTLGTLLSLILFDFVGLSKLLFLLRSLSVCSFFKPIY